MFELLHQLVDLVTEDLNSLRSSDLYARLYLPFYVWSIQQVVFHATGLLFEYFDRTNKFPSSKVRHVNLDRKPYLSLLPRVLFNQVFLLLPSMCLSTLAGLCFYGPTEGQHLHPLRFLLNLPAMAIGHDVIQYLAHRYLLHQPNIHLMRFLKHSVHHSTGATRGISACYMAAPDFLLEIVGPYLIPLALVGGGGSDYFFHSLVAGMGAIGGIYEHSGYDFSIHFVDPTDAITTQDILASYPVKPTSASDSASATKQHQEAASSPLSIRRLACLFLANFLDNRSHGEHHTRANVSFSDGFGSPSIMDTLLKTRWSDIARPKRWSKKSSSTRSPVVSSSSSNNNKDTTTATITAAAERLAEEQREAKEKRMQEVEKEWQRLREEGRRAGGGGGSQRKTTSRSNSHDSNFSSIAHSDAGGSSCGNSDDGLVTPPDHEHEHALQQPQSLTIPTTSATEHSKPTYFHAKANVVLPPTTASIPSSNTTALDSASLKLQQQQILTQRVVPAVAS